MFKLEIDQTSYRLRWDLLELCTTRSFALKQLATETLQDKNALRARLPKHKRILDIDIRYCEEHSERAGSAGLI